MRLKLAIRNITRHRMRSLLSICMIAGAVTSMILFQGFSEYSLAALKFTASENQYGNMQIAADKYWNPGKEPRTERIFPLSKLDELRNKFPEVVNVSGRLSFFGLISNGDVSVGGKIIGIDPAGEPSFKDSIRYPEGKFFDVNGSKEIVIGKLLAKQMNVHPGDNITVLTNTIDGVMNAMDLTVAGVFAAGIDEIDSQVIFAPLGVTQEILDTQSVDIAVLKFKDLKMVDISTKKINDDLSKNKTDLVARSWRELAVLYRQVEKFYEVQNSLIEAILLALMFLGILNTVSMTVVERTGEIGTLRALGESRKKIVTQFLLESVMLSFIGIVSGILFSLFMIQVVEYSKIMTEMPGASTPFQIKIYFMMSSVIYASFLASATTIIATLIPAMRSSKMDIVEALRKNI